MCRDGMCGADDCQRCHPRERPERDPDEVYETKRQEALEQELDEKQD